MKRLINSELIQKVKDLMLSVWSDSEGNLEVGKNLEVDGNATINGWFYAANYEFSEEDDDSTITANFDAEARDCSLSLNLNENQFGTNGGISIRKDLQEAIYSIWFYEQKDEYKEYEILHEGNVNKLAHLYRHTIEISNDTSSVVFQANLDNNVVIDSVQDLTTALGSTELSASGYIGANIVSKITIGASASAITIKTNGGNKTLTDITGFVVADSVTL